MANALAVQTLEDGPRHTILKITGEIDTADVAGFVVADPAFLTGIDSTGLVKAANLRIRHIDHIVQDTFAVKLFWDATTPTLIETLTGRGKVDYEFVSGLQNNAGAGSTGRILLSTRGWVAAAVLSFALTLQLIKQQT